MSDHNAPDLSIVGDRLTLHPPGVTQDQETPLLTSYARFRSSPLDFLREASLHLSGTGWRSFDDFIGQNIFYNGFSDHIKSLVLKNPRLVSKISELAHKRLDVELAEGTISENHVDERRKQMEDQLTQVADSWTDQMICKMDSRRFIRGAYYIATQLLTRAYHQGKQPSSGKTKSPSLHKHCPPFVCSDSLDVLDCLVVHISQLGSFFGYPALGRGSMLTCPGIHVSSEEVMRLRQVAQEAERKKQSIIFLPCHRSHVDYVSLQLICYRLGLALPIVVAGDNLNFPVCTVRNLLAGSTLICKRLLVLSYNMLVGQPNPSHVSVVNYLKVPCGYGVVLATTHCTLH